MEHARLFTHLYHNTLMLPDYSDPRKASSRCRSESPTRHPPRGSHRMCHLLFHQDRCLFKRKPFMYTGIYIIVVLGVSTTTSPGTVSPAILNRALTHIELRRTLRGCCSELNLVADHHRRTVVVSSPERALPRLLEAARRSSTRHVAESGTRDSGMKNGEKERDGEKEREREKKRNRDREREIARGRPRRKRGEGDETREREGTVRESTSACQLESQAASRLLARKLGTCGWLNRRPPIGAAAGRSLRKLSGVLFPAVFLPRRRHGGTLSRSLPSTRSLRSLCVPRFAVPLPFRLR